MPLMHENYQDNKTGTLGSVGVQPVVSLVSASASIQRESIGIQLNFYCHLHYYQEADIKHDAE